MKKIQIISFNVPFPADYGGIIDVFYKIKALKESGIAIILHCFDYGRGKSLELEQLCDNVFYYHRKKSIIHQFSKLPFIVKTRNSSTLIDNLNKFYDIPILAEGLHCTFPLFSEKCKNTNFYVRTHNIEHAYYQGLSNSETNYFKKIYFSIEAKKLKRYEPVLTKAKGICAISPNDKKYFTAINSNSILISPFHPFQKVNINKGTGDFILVHGNLSVSENICSTQWLINEVFSKLNKKVIIAGKNPHHSIISLAQRYKHIQLIANPPFDLMQNLIVNTQIHIIHSFWPQGMKLKLLNALYNGRHCICNKAVVQNTGLEHLCNIANDSKSMIQLIVNLMQKPFDNANIRKRQDSLYLYSNELQVKKLIKFLKL